VARNCLPTFSVRSFGSKYSSTKRSARHHVIHMQRSTKYYTRRALNLSARRTQLPLAQCGNYVARFLQGRVFAELDLTQDAVSQSRIFSRIRAGSACIEGKLERRRILHACVIESCTHIALESRLPQAASASSKTSVTMYSIAFDARWRYTDLQKQQRQRSFKSSTVNLEVYFPHAYPVLPEHTIPRLKEVVHVHGFFLVIRNSATEYPAVATRQRGLDGASSSTTH
jgi:hypothetical protein